MFNIFKRLANLEKSLEDHFNSVEWSISYLIKDCNSANELSKDNLEKIDLILNHLGYTVVNLPSVPSHKVLKEIDKIKVEV